MSHRASMYLGILALAAQILVLQSCSSSSPAPAGGTGGGTSSGTGGSPGGSGGAGGTAQTTVKNAVVCPSGLDNHAACTTGDPCWKTCGPVASGFKNCNCTGTEWLCPTCTFEAGGNYACFHLPANLQACPADSSDPLANPMMLPKANDPCMFPTCQPCGSGAGFAYRDSGGTPKVGYCVCTAADGTGKLSCGSAQEWPPQ